MISPQNELQQNSTLQENDIVFGKRKLDPLYDRTPDKGGS
jgi:hypothetical protein